MILSFIPILKIITIGLIGLQNHKCFRCSEYAINNIKIGCYEEGS